ncbi:MAG TPA: polymorphic toxin-type HINT domain-containing protein [Chthonomonadaceae bacterium]|nr:polymorphic toxin-type HINT domain-containing protein [Chthonomonadaceae bacterium]
MLTGLIPGYGLIPALTGHDAWGCPLSPMERVISGLGGAASLMPLADAGEEAAAADESVATSTGCFVAGTPLAVAASQEASDQAGDSQATVVQPIEQIKQGERLQAATHRPERWEFKRVERTTVRKVAMVVTVTLAEATSGQIVDAITATPEHPFYEVGKGFVEAQSLGIGSQVVTRAGPPLVVKSLTFKSRKAGYTAYNLVSVLKRATTWVYWVS